MWRGGVAGHAELVGASAATVLALALCAVACCRRGGCCRRPAQESLTEILDEIAHEALGVRAPTTPMAAPLLADEDDAT